MEDSYIVHRRRKAAARKREKTPDPSSRGTASLMDTSDDEDEERRARMEKMAEEAERMEQQPPQQQQQRGNKPAQKQSETLAKGEPMEKANKRRDDQEQPASKRKSKTETRNSANMDDMIAVRAEVAVKSAAATAVVAGNSSKTLSEIDVATIVDDSNARPIKQTTETASKPDDDGIARRESFKKEIVGATREKNTRETSETPKETNGETARPAQEVRKVERRFKRKSKERVERYSRSTDSSDMEERSESSRRRTKSPEAARPRLRKTSGRSRVSDPEAQKKDAERMNREKRSSSRQKLEDEPERAEDKDRTRGKDRDSEKSCSRFYSKAEDADEEAKLTRKDEESSSPGSVDERAVKRCSTEPLKKQIIPLSNDSLIEDFAKAQRLYLLRERNILEAEDLFQDAIETSLLRRRKFSLAHTESEHEDIIQDVTRSSDDKKKRSWFPWLFFWHGTESINDEETKKSIEDEPKPIPRPEEVKTAKREAEPERITFLDFFRALRDIVGEFKAFVAQNRRQTMIIRRLRNRCAADLLLVIIYCGLGAFVFRFTEGAFETFYKCGVKRVKRDFLDSLWDYSHNMREDDWKSMARRKLMEFEEQLHTAHEAGLHSYSGQKSWSFLNAVTYCLTVITTIGYGHISPSTNAGRAITIVYAIFGIPMFLIVLADFGKLFTRGIKFLWAFVRRLYYTGSCRKVRRTVPVQEVMKGVQLVYDLATFRRPSQMNPQEMQEIQEIQRQQAQTVLNVEANAAPDTPGTPALSAFAVDDEFNLPISVAIFILLVYIFVGATLYHILEDWGFFESFYFVFISMSTIGFGDYVPKDPTYMMCSIVYLVFGLALTSMCINVVQEMLSDSFKQASQKIGATIGFEVAEDDNSVKPAPPPSVEIADVHTSTKEPESNEQVAAKAKREDVDL